MALWTPSSPAMAISSPRCHDDLDGGLLDGHFGEHLRREGPRHEDLVGRAAGEQCPPPCQRISKIIAGSNESIN